MNEEPSRRLRGIVFDLDGVLWASAAMHEEAFLIVLAPYAVRFDYAEISGRRTRDVMAHLLPELAAEEIEKLAGRKSEVALKLLRGRNPVAADAIDVLERLAAFWPLAIATSGSQRSVNTFLEMNGCRELFRAVVHEGMVEHAKPHPSLFISACNGIGFRPEECLVVEDSVAGVIAGRDAGCVVFGISADSEMAEKLRQAGATDVIPDLASLIQLLGLNQERQWNESLIRRLRRPNVRKQDWSAIVPAAGHGSRLGFELPKILFPVEGRVILDWLLDLLVESCGEIVLVVSPAGAQPVWEHIRKTGISDRVCLVEQAQPLGMAHAVATGAAAVSTRHALIVWGDQVALRKTTIDATVALHECTAALATIPTVYRRDPYVHFERDATGRITGVLQAREGDAMPATGESDAGIFCFRTFALRRYLEWTSDSPSRRGALTREDNFLPVLPFLDGVPGNLLTAEILEEEESVGVNSRRDAEALGLVLRARRTAGGI